MYTFLKIYFCVCTLNPDELLLFERIKITIATRFIEIVKSTVYVYFVVVFNCIYGTHCSPIVINIIY